jgi:outer membrane protein assembly factor BamB
MNRTIALVLTLLTGFAHAEENWPQFRGPTGQGHSDAKDLPLIWSETQNVKWKAAVHGKGWSSPVVWGSQVWLTTATEDGQGRFALCFDRETGKVVHDLKLVTDPAPNPIFKNFNSYASPTPVIEEGRIYVTFGAAGTFCVDTKGGNVIWRREDIKVNHYRGAGSSLFLYEGLLYLNFDGSDAQFIVALDKSTGDTVWRKDRSVDYKDLDPKTGMPKTEGDYRKAFSTDRIITVNGKPALISTGSVATYAYEPKTGEEIWRWEHPSYHSCGATPVFADGMIYHNPGFGTGGLFAVKPDGKGVLPKENVLWSIKKDVPTRPSVLFVDGRIYMASDVGIATCVEAATGKVLWSQRIKGKQAASPIYADGRIYFFGEQGTTTVLQPGGEFKVLAENTLEDGAVMGSPAVAGKAIFVRTKSNLYRLEK